jgi:hypothetical protein
LAIEPAAKAGTKVKKQPAPIETDPLKQKVEGPKYIWDRRYSFESPQSVKLVGAEENLFQNNILKVKKELVKLSSKYPNSDELKKLVRWTVYNLGGDEHKLVASVFGDKEGRFHFVNDDGKTYTHVKLSDMTVEQKNRALGAFMGLVLGAAVDAETRDNSSVIIGKINDAAPATKECMAAYAGLTDADLEAMFKAAIEVRKANAALPEFQDKFFEVKGALKPGVPAVKKLYELEFNFDTADKGQKPRDKVAQILEEVTKDLWAERPYALGSTLTSRG